MKKLSFCLLSLMLCLSMVFIHIQDTFAIQQAIDIEGREQINIVLGKTVQIDTWECSHFQFENNDNIVSMNNDYITAKNLGVAVLTYQYGESEKKSLTINVVAPYVLDKTAYQIFREDGYYDPVFSVHVNWLNDYSYISTNYDDNIFLNHVDYQTGIIEFYVYFDNQNEREYTFNVDGQDFSVKVSLVEAELKANNTISNQIGSLVTYSGKSDTLSLKFYGKKANASQWATTNSKVATVNSAGKVTGKGVGRCYIRAYSKTGDYLEYLVECTYKGAYQAVLNGFNDMLKGDNGKIIQYSQPKRMSKGYRDCSSFVSRCYYDTTLSRKILKIGNIKGNYASTAADQAKWLNSKDKKVADGLVDKKNLLPGDCIYTRGSSDNGRWRKIYHTVLYVGNGLTITTSSSKATLKLRRYDYNAHNIVFIGRPLKPKVVKTTSISLNKTSVTLGVKEKFTLKAVRKPTNSTQKATFKSSNSAIASVASSGVITAKKSGTAYITVVSGSKSKKCKVVVKKAPSSIKLNARSKTIRRKKTFQLKTTLTKGSVSNKITYKSSNSKVASVSSSGKITAKKNGKATITVTTFNGKKASIKITVK